jgi:glucose-1-phosphate adenylyltransferase
MKNALAVILGGGRGTRLYPLTRYRAKPAVPIGGKFRLIDIPISNCLHWGLKKIFILTQFNTASLHRHIYTTYKFDGFSSGFVQILAAQQTIDNKNWYQGTADAVRQNLNFIRNQDVDYVIILSGDQLYRINLFDFLEFHRQKNADISIASKPISREEAKGLGILKVDAERRIVDFAEKPKEQAALDRLYNPAEYLGAGIRENYIASMGIYIFNRQVLIDRLVGNDDQDFGKQIIPDSIGSCRVFSYIFDGYWEDIGTVGSFFEANLDFARPVPRFNFYDELNPIFTHARFLPGSKIKECQVNQSLLAEGSILEGSKISDSVLGIRSIVRQGTTLERVVMMGADFYESPHSQDPVKVGIGRNCHIRNAIIDKNVRIGENVYIHYRGGESDKECGAYCVADGIVVIAKNETIADNTRIE